MISSVTSPTTTTATTARSRRLVPILGWLVVLATVGWFSCAVATYHHPVFGLTRFFQLQEDFAARALPEVAHGPVYVNEGNAGYDGQFYAQLALRPTLHDPALQEAIDNPPMRARRILASWVAALVGGGQPDRVLHAYAWLNVVAWFLLGGVLLILFPPRHLHNIVAWFGLMTASGTITSVRYALTDMPALLLLAGAMVLLERRPRGFGAATLMALAALARETSVLAGTALLPGSSWRDRILRGFLLVTPLLAWLIYVRLTLGAETASLGNFAWPLTTWWAKCRELVTAYATYGQTDFYWHAIACLIALTVQVVWLAVRPRWRDAWWQFGIGYVVLFAVLGWPTFEGYPGAYTRILLPLLLAFNRLVPTTRAGLVLLLAGNLSVFSGFSMLRDGHAIERELAAETIDDVGYIVKYGEGWYGRETASRHQWLWCEQAGQLEVDRYSALPPTVETGVLRFNLNGFVRADVRILQDDHEIWHGVAPVGGKIVELPLARLDFTATRTATLTFVTSTPPGRESDDPDARHLTFAVYDPEIVTSAP